MKEIRVSDLIKFKAKIIYKTIFRLKALKIEFYDENKELKYFVNLSEKNIEEREFILYGEECQMVLEGSFGKRVRFLISDLAKKERWRMIDKNSSIYTYENSNRKDLIVWNDNYYDVRIKLNKQLIARIEKNKIDVVNLEHIGIILSLYCAFKLPNLFYGKRAQL
ncbi:hypothetical protein [Aureivirga marina]|uniref:hypothetical protein n=1 Tax=Aureivirga marina TaxID=1182451 RepID=UPI0018CBB543|nr:hypothetical protein [Aureivirga marina]